MTLCRRCNPHDVQRGRNCRCHPRGIVQPPVTPLTVRSLQVTMEGKDSEPDTIYAFQGIILLCLGFDTFCVATKAAISLQPITGRKCELYLHTAVSLFVLPILWGLLVAACFSSDTYYCSDFPCRAKHYIYPLMVIFRNKDIWLSIVQFILSVNSAAPVLLLFFCFLLALSGIAMLLMRGVYKTG